MSGRGTSGWRRRAAVAAWLIGLAALLSACGSASQHPASPASSSHSSGPPHCDALPAGGYHTCVFEGHPYHGETYPIVQRGKAVHVYDLTAKIDSVTTSTLSPAPAAYGLGRARAHGTFIIVNLTVTSSDTHAGPPPGDAFYEQGSGMVGLVDGQTVLTPSSNAEGADPHSFLNGKYFEPGDSRTGDVIFDVPSTSVRSIVDNDAILLTGFGFSIGGGFYGLLKLT